MRRARNGARLCYEPSDEPSQQLRGIAPLQRAEAGGLQLREACEVGELFDDIIPLEVRPVAPVRTCLSAY
jgi:hypothetical protein